MTEKDDAQLLLCGESVVPPEELDWDVTVEGRAREAIYKSSAVDIIDHIGKQEFKTTYMVLKHDVFEDQPLSRKIRFVENVLEKISEVYDFEFPEKIDITDEVDIQEFMKFLEFLEYDNIDFLSNVWRFLEADLMKIDIKDFCFAIANKIIKETEQLLPSRDDPELISIFLRTYYKDGYISWFVKNTEQAKIDIIIETKGV